MKWHLITIAYGARVCGSVFNIKFRILAREFESIETYPGFVLLREENRFKVIKIADRFRMLEKNH